MEIESLFSSTRWDILKALSRKKLSPLELAAEMKTTSANISQQLRLLELGGLVKSEKTSNVEKGKPRIVYSLAGDNAFVIIASPSFAEKKQLSLTSYHKFLMRAWFIDEVYYHSAIGELYFLLKNHLKNIRMISVLNSREPVIYITLENQKSLDSVKKAVNDFKKVRINFSESAEQKKKDVIVLYDSIETSNIEVE